MNAPHPASAALTQTLAARPTLAELEARDAFAERHIGPSPMSRPRCLPPSATLAAPR